MNYSDYNDASELLGLVNDSRFSAYLTNLMRKSDDQLISSQNLDDFQDLSEIELGKLNTQIMVSQYFKANTIISFKPIKNCFCVVLLLFLFHMFRQGTQVSKTSCSCGCSGCFSFRK